MRKLWWRVLLKLGMLDRVQWWRQQGATIGRGCHIMDEVRLDPGHERFIVIEDAVTLGPGVCVLAHDASSYLALGYTRQAKVVIEERVFVGARAIILPGVRIGRGSIVGAGSVVTRDVPVNVVVAGNPARVLMSKADFITRRREEVKQRGTSGTSGVDGVVM